jgi:membrane-associated protease RseP (regulator of RpoE activity)
VRGQFFSLAICGVAVLFTGKLGAQPLAVPQLPNAPQEQASEPGYLGLVADDRNENNRGARVKEVFEGSPALMYGLKTGDLVIAIDSKPVRSLDDFGGILQTLTAGSKVRFDVERNGQPQAIEVTLSRRPPPEERRFQTFGRIPASSPQNSQQSSQTQNPNGLSPVPANRPIPRPLLGVQTLPVTEETRARLRLPSTAGALVTSRTLGSPAEKANIPLDAVIVALDGQRVSNPNDLSALLVQAGEGRSVEITYLYNGESPKARLTLGMGGGPSMSMPNNNPPGSAAVDTARRPMIPPQSMNPNSSAPNSAMPNNTMMPNPAMPNGMSREEMLEQRIQQLERRLKQLEDQLHPGT